MSRIKNIFFDNDGILVDTEKFFYKANVDICTRFGIDFSEEAFTAAVLKDATGPWPLFREKGFSQEEILKLKDERNEIYNGYLQQEDISLPDVKDTLNRMHRKYRKAIVTSSTRKNFETIHNKTGFLKFFEFTLTLEDYKKCKPSGDPYITALRKMGADPSETIVVEDSARGLEASVNAGIRCVVIPTQLTASQDFSKAYMRLQSIKDLPEFLASIK